MLARRKVPAKVARRRAKFAVWIDLVARGRVREIVSICLLAFGHILGLGWLWIWK